MRFRNRFVLLIAPFVLVLAGCFQQAGTALQEPIVTNQAVSVPPTSIPLPTDAGTGSTDNTNTTGDNGQGEILETPTFNFVPGDSTSTVEGSDSGSTDTTNTDSGNPPVALTIISATLPPVATEVPPESPTTDGSQIVDGQTTPSGGQFITPSGPLGPYTQVPIVATTGSGDTGSTGEPASTPSGLVTPTAFAPIDSEGNCTHTIAAGDTLYRIALKYQVTVAQIREANPDLVGDIIQPGDVLKVPNCNPTTGGSTTTNVEPTTGPSVPATALPSGSQTYVVKRGDTLYTIGLQFGVTSDAIQKANNISNPNRINPGDKLVIPAKSG